jgi:hypothetical protein
VSARDYHFVSSFTVGAAPQRVHEVLVDLEHYGSWWPQVRAVAKLDDDRALVVCRSSLPYDLDLLLTAESREPHRLEVSIDGPIRGWARFGLTGSRHGRRPGTTLRFEQEVRAESPAFVGASYAVRPLLVWNHHRMMLGAERGLLALLGAGSQPRAAIAAS